MPRKDRRLRSEQKKAKELQELELLNNIPSHIKQRVLARACGVLPASETLPNLLNSEDPPESRMRGGLMGQEKDGTDSFLLKTGGYIFEHNEVLVDAKRLDIEALEKKYPDDWLKRGGARRIAKYERESIKELRAVKPRPNRLNPISERTIQNYFKEIRKASRKP